MEQLKSVNKALEILNCFSYENPEMGVTAISKQLNLPKSTTSRLLAALRNHDFVIQSSASKKFRLGMKVLKLSGIAKTLMDEWVIHARPHLKDLRDRTGETTALHVLERDQRVCIEEFPSLNELRPFLGIGGHYPLHAGSPGKLLLAYLPEEERRVILLKNKLPRYTPKTLTDIEALEKEFSRIRKKGYAVSCQERVMFLSSISAPIKNYENKVIAAVCIHGPAIRLTLPMMLKFKNILIETTAKISKELGFEPKNDRK